MDKLTTIIGDYQTFLQVILKKVADAGFDMSDFSQLDHLGYRTTSAEQYEEKKQQLHSVGALLGETIVNGRPIATFRLSQPLRSGSWRVDAIELIAPKASKPKPEGPDHIEFVLYDDQQTFLKKYTDKTFVLDSADRGINPEVAFALGDGMSVKFHLLSLTTVLYIENKLDITEVK